MSHNKAPSPSESEIFEPSQPSRAVVWEADEGGFYMAGIFDQPDTVVPIKNMADRAGMRVGTSEDGLGDTVIIRTESGKLIALAEDFCLDQNGKLHRLPEQAPDISGYAQPEVPHIVIGQTWEPVEGAGETSDRVAQVYFDYDAPPVTHFSDGSKVPLIPFDEMRNQIIALSSQLQTAS